MLIANYGDLLLLNFLQEADIFQLAFIRYEFFEDLKSWNDVAGFVYYMDFIWNVQRFIKKFT
jgi:hypothetical protein